MSHRLLLASNDDDVVRLAAALAGEGDGLEVVDVVTELDRVPRVLRRTGPDVLVLHDHRGTTPAFQRTRELSVAFPEVGIVVVVSGEVTTEIARSGMQAGARDVISLTLEDLDRAVRAAATLARTLRNRVSGDSEAAAAGGIAGKIVMVAGAKGGAGASTVALHLAMSAVAERPDRSTCLVDLDLQAGDLGVLLDVPPRRSIVDLVDVADELSYRQLEDAVYGHASGVSLLPAPPEGERAEEVTIEVARNVLGALRTRHDLVVVDAGAYFSEATAAACELADRVVVVVTPDGPALLGARRLLELWRRLLDFTPADTRLLVNRVSKDVELQPGVVQDYVATPALRTHIPAAFKALEAAANTAMPGELVDRRMKEAYADLLDELDVLPEAAAGTPARARGRSGFLRRLAGDEGQSSVEMVGLLPVLAIVVLGIWQLGLIGYTYLAAGDAAREGARALATGEEEGERVREDVPGAWQDGLRCEIGDDRVKVSLAVPVVLPGVDSPWRISSSAGTTVEDQPVAAPALQDDEFRPKRRKDDPCNDSDA